MREEAYKNAFSMTSDRRFSDALNTIKPILEDDTRDDLYYKTLKLYADIIGPMTHNDLFLSIDMYQTIINECEDDDVYAASQIAQLEAQLSISMHFMENFENTRDVIESEDAFTQTALDRLDAMREKFIVGRAETIYKNRM